jgi:hypothetical protein
MMRILQVAAALAALAIAAPAASQSGWTKLGQREVNDSVERDTIRARGGTQWRQMMICAEQAPVRFLDVTVRYRNGGTQDVRLRSLIRAGSCTRDINLRGRERDIEAVDFTYEAASLGRARARVDLFAR